MKIVELDKDNIQYFYGFDPFSYLDGDMPKERFALGAVREDKSGDYPMGVMLCESYMNMLIIRWLCVDPDNRGNGYGDALLSAALDAAMSVNMIAVAAMLGKEPERSTVCPDERQYFEEHGFDREETIGGYEETMLVRYL